MNTSIGFVKDEENKDNPYHKMVIFFKFKPSKPTEVFFQKKYVAFFAFLGIISGVASIITGIVFKKVFTALIDDDEVLSQSQDEKNIFLKLNFKNRTAA